MRNAPLPFTDAMLLVGVTDVEGSALNVSGVPAATTNGVIALTASGYTYTPATGYIGNDSFSFVVTDADGASTPRDAVIIVTGEILEATAR